MFTKLVRIGRDAEMKYLATGMAVLEMSVVYDVGFGDKKKGQWVKLAMFGARAEKLVTHFTKGKQIVVTMDEVQSEGWGEGKHAMSAKLVEFSFVNDGNGGQSQQASQQGGYQNQAPQQPPAQQAAPQMAPTYQQQQAPHQTPAPQNHGAPQNTPSMNPNNPPF